MFGGVHTTSWVVMIAVLALTAGCKGGGSSGGGGGTTPTGGVVNGTFVKDAHKTSVGPWAGGHFGTGYGSWRTQHLYSGTSGTTQISGSGYITAIGFKVDAAVVSAFSCTGVTITMGHTSLGALTTVFASNIGQSRGAAVTVLGDRTITIPVAGAGEYIRIDLDTPFHFNGVEKLVVDFRRAGTCTGSVALRYDNSVPGNQALYTDDLAATTGMLTSPPNMRFHFSGGDSSVEFGGASAGPAPFTSASSRVLLLYTAGEINGSGPITGLGFQTDQLTTEQTYSYTVTMGHTAQAMLSPTFTANLDAGPPTAMAAGAFTVPANISAGSYFWIPLTGTFTYNGKDNLLVGIDVSAGSGDTVLRWGTGVSARRVSGASGAVLGVVDDKAYHARFRFKGGTVDVLTPNGMFGADSFPFFADTGKRQFLYRATEIGTKGTITRIACRNANGYAVATDLLELAVVMSHTTSTALGADFGANMSAPVTVVSGTFATPATAWGDWVDIPLTTPFEYNGTDNLVVQYAGSGFGSGAPACALDMYSSGRYPSRRVASLDQSAAVGELVSDYLMDMRFTFQ